MIVFPLEYTHSGFSKLFLLPAFCAILLEEDSKFKGSWLISQSANSDFLPVKTPHFFPSFKMNFSWKVSSALCTVIFWSSTDTGLNDMPRNSGSSGWVLLCTGSLSWQRPVGQSRNRKRLESGSRWRRKLLHTSTFLFSHSITQGGFLLKWIVDALQWIHNFLDIAVVFWLVLEGWKPVSWEIECLYKYLIRSLVGYTPTGSHTSNPSNFLFLFCDSYPKI